MSIIAALVSVSAIPIPAHAGTNGQQLIINVCNAKSLSVRGSNQNNQTVTGSYTLSGSGCVQQKTTGWWWKNVIRVTATYADGRSNFVDVNVPVNQSGDWFTVNMPSLPPIGDTYVARGKMWVDKRLPYNQGATANPDGSSASRNSGYRTDCSGFVSMAWGLDAKGLDVPNTVALSNYANTLNSKDALLPGDAINNRKWGNDGHVVLFVRWIDKSAGRFIAYEENGSYGATQTNLTLVPKGSAWSIKEYSNNGQRDPWFLERKK